MAWWRSGFSRESFVSLCTNEVRSTAGSPVIIAKEVRTFAPRASCFTRGFLVAQQLDCRGEVGMRINRYGMGIVDKQKQV